MAENVCPPDHKHAGSPNCRRHHGCMCTPCVMKSRQAQADYRRRKKLGRVNGMVDSRGTRRRLQALVANGWSIQQLAYRLHTSKQSCREIFSQDVVTRAMRNRVARLFKTMWDQFPPTTNRWERTSASRTRNYAAAKGWVTALAWDDIDNDPEPATTERTDDVDEIAVELACRGERVKLTTREKEQVVTILHGKRLSDSAIAELLGCPPETPWRIRQRLNLPPNYDAAGELVAA